MLKAKLDKIQKLLFTTYIISCKKKLVSSSISKSLLAIRKFSSKNISVLNDFAVVLLSLEHDLLIIYSLFLKIILARLFSL